MTKGEKVKGSWRTAYGYTFLSSDDMDVGQEKTLTILEVTKEDAYDRQSKQNKPLISVSFKETERLLALNATNAKAISEIAGSPMVEKWQGVRVTLYRTEEKFFGKTGALRIKSPPPQAVQQQQAAQA